MPHLLSKKQQSMGLLDFFIPPRHVRHTQPGGSSFALRYWLFWGLLVAVLAYSINRYFDYRNRELDKRLEQINTPRD